MNEETIQNFDQYLIDYVESVKTPAKNLKEAIIYSLFNGGKRARPRFVFLTGEMLGLDSEALFPAAAAIELIHAYSLIHDDLPAMDDDDFRRGKPSNHKVFGEALAILAGDAMFSLSYQILTDGARKQNYPDKALIAMINELNIATGLIGMVAGQVLDIEEKAASLEDLIEMHSLKTGALIKAAISLPAILAGLDEQRSQFLRDYARHIGLAFQIKDDLLDFEGSLESLGKTPQKDLTKKTFLTILGREKADRLLAEETEKAISSLLIFGEKSNLLIGFSKYLLERNK